MEVEVQILQKPEEVAVEGRWYTVEPDGSYHPAY
jgi:hypothetical protein